MSESFDPYYTWLGILPHEQPPNHYRLLGISTFEASAEVISNAADRVALHLRAFQAGQRGKESQQLLDEVAAARATLLDPERKSAYDAQLQALQRSQTPDVIALPPAAPLAPAAPPRVLAEPERAEGNSTATPVIPIMRPPTRAPGSQRAARPAARRRRPTPAIVIILLVAAALVALGGGIAFVVSRFGSLDSGAVVRPTQLLAGSHCLPGPHVLFHCS